MSVRNTQLTMNRWTKGTWSAILILCAALVSAPGTLAVADEINRQAPRRTYALYGYVKVRQHFVWEVPPQGGMRVSGITQSFDDNFDLELTNSPVTVLTSNEDILTVHGSFKYSGTQVNKTPDISNVPGFHELCELSSVSNAPGKVDFTNWAAVPFILSAGENELGSHNVTVKCSTSGHPFGIGTFFANAVPRLPKVLFHTDAPKLNESESCQSGQGCTLLKFSGRVTPSRTGCPPTAPGGRSCLEDWEDWDVEILARPCWISSITKAEPPVDHKRTKIGVGEQVDLSFLPAGEAEWRVSSGLGRLADVSGGHAIFLSGELPGSSTIQADNRSLNCKATITFDVVAPNGLLLEPSGAVYHTRNRLDIGFRANAYLTPDDVSFEGIYINEDDVPSVAQGCYSPLNHTGHQATTEPTMVGKDVPGKGSQLWTDNPGDTVYSGDPGLTLGQDAILPGYIRWDIPLAYRSDIDTTPHQFAVVPETATCEPDGKGGWMLNIEKAGASASTSAASEGSPLPKP
jgi:hypothetical protein